MKLYTPHSLRRIFALFIDSIITTSFAGPLFFNALILAGKNQGFLLPWHLLIGTWVLQMAYHIFFLYFLGATVGKLILGLRVVPFHNPNEKLQFMQAVLRVVCDQFGLFFGHAHRCLAFFRLDRRHLSDWVAETRVVQLFPRQSLPKRRWIIGLIAAWFLAVGGLRESYEVIQSLKIKKAGILLPAHLNLSIQFESRERN